METAELMQLSAIKALDEVSWESIEYLFKPTTFGELLCRLCLEDVKQKAHEWIHTTHPSAMPHRFRGPYIRELNLVIQREEFYRAMKELHDANES